MTAGRFEASGIIEVVLPWYYVFQHWKNRVAKRLVNTAKTQTKS